MIDDDITPLCCCEYYDSNRERRHILECFCNCVDLDVAFDKCISCRKISQKTKAGLVRTMQDRLRIPWKGGAKQVAFDALLPVAIIPIMLLTAAISLWWTIFSFTTVAIFIMLIYKFFVHTIPNTKFFYVWTWTSLIVLYLIFEFMVIPLLEILLEENVALTIFILGFFICVYTLITRTRKLGNLEESEFENLYGAKKGSRIEHCTICQVKIPDKDHHCFWFDSCIGRHNHCLFLLALFFAICALLYSSNLTLTTVCHPFTLYKTILLPDDCSDVYKLFELGLSFVTAVYSVVLALFLLVVLLHQLLLVSIGITRNEWTTLPVTSKLCFGLTSKRPNNQGFFRNWYTVICWKKAYYNALNYA